jgi:putative transposase
LPATLSRWPLKRVDEAFKAFFRRLKVSYPRFRGKSGWRSFGFTEFVGIRLINGRLVVRGLAGGLKLHMHRPLPDGASMWPCVFTKEGRAWRVTLQIEVPDIHTVRREAGDLVGLDWGVETLATLSTGEGITNLRFGTEASAGIRRASRKLARAKRGSRRRLKAKARLAGCTASSPTAARPIYIRSVPH